MKALVIVIMVAAVGGIGTAQASDAAQEVFQRVFSPCCYRETLDMHASPQADELRPEIRGRIRRGEPSEAILADMVRRYGPDVLTRPPGRGVSAALFVAAGVFAAALLLLAALRSRHPAAPAPVPRDPANHAEGESALLDRLTDEIARLD